MAVDITVVNPAKGHRELVAHLEAHCPWLSEPKVMSVSRASPADQTWLGCHVFKVRLIAQSTWLAERKHAFVNLFVGSIGLLKYRIRWVVLGRWSNTDR